MEGEPYTRREEKTLPGEHSATGQRVHGIRRLIRKHKDADKISEDIERYPSTTRFIESSLGIKSYSIEILHWVDNELHQNRNDTIHEFLAYLAEQMIEMNKRKNEEIRGFLKWLEREVGAKIDDLTNKTAIRDHHEHSFDDLLEVLKKNKKKISGDPSDRKTQELIGNHYIESMSRLIPLKTKIRATDGLIDEIVYKLYGLTEEGEKIIKSEYN